MLLRNSNVLDQEIARLRVTLYLVISSLNPTFEGDPIFSDFISELLHYTFEDDPIVIGHL